MSTLYITSLSSDNKYLLGGVWTLYQQEGCPMEELFCLCKSTNFGVDWCEAMANAGVRGELPAFLGIIRTFLQKDEVEEIITKMDKMLKLNITFQDILDKKRQDSRAFIQAFP